ncbi:hypothetical protein PsorP6_002212 [Peronosclerospora sorghi]|uniref:Uncharacterized protein n=1 Tax=Peronosclerospora sorghi TaxID=230839 RepID=A0ACC0WST6_9STRA|nr:hypothetical protein PsorP6_002212 [Peronosclerospora sorghi]
MQLAQVDILRCLAVLNNARQLPDATLVAAAHHRIKNTDWTREERRSFSYMMALHGAPCILAKRVVVAPDGRATPSMLPFVTEHARDFSSDPIFNHSYFVSRDNVVVELAFVKQRSLAWLAFVEMRAQAL